MLQLFPFLAWLAVATSVGLLAAMWMLGEMGVRTRIVLFVWLVAAAYCQFFGPSSMVSAIGLLLQTILAIYLIFRWRLSA